MNVPESSPNNKYLYIFYLFGYSSYNPRVEHDTVSPSTSARNLLPAIARFLLATATLFTCFYYHHFLVDFAETTNTFGIYFLMMSFLCVSAAVTHQVLFRTGESFRDLSRHFEVVAGYFKSHLVDDGLVQRFQRNFHRTALILLFNLTMTVVVKYVLLSPTTHIVVQTCLLVQMLLSNFAFLHVFYYVSLLQHYLKLVAPATLIEEFKLGIVDVTQIADHFKYYKNVYTKLWETSLAVNNIFGWTLLALLLQYGIDFTYSLYWMFLYYYVSETTLFLSKYTYYLNLSYI